jgi:hypothetical protein
MAKRVHPPAAMSGRSVAVIAVIAMTRAVVCEMEIPVSEVVPECSGAFDTITRVRFKADIPRLTVRQGHHGSQGLRRCSGDISTFENLPKHCNQFIGIKWLRKKGNVTKDCGKIGTVVTGHEDNGPASPTKDLGYWHDAFAPQIHIKQGYIAIYLIYNSESRFNGTHASGNVETM